MEFIKKFIHSKWMAALIGGAIYLATSALLTWQAIPGLVQPTVKKDPTRFQYRPDPSWNFYNPEINQLIAELKAARKQLEDRSAELDALEARLKTERTELDELIGNVGLMQERFDETFIQVEEAEMANLKKLAKLYAAMDAVNAVTILQQMDDAALVRILMFMRESDTAPIMESLALQGEAEAKRAAVLSDLLRRSIPPNTASLK